MTLSRLLAASFALASAAMLGGATLSACDGEPAGVVFGVTTEIKPGALLTRLDASVSVDGTGVIDDRYEGDALEFPLEIRVDDLEGGEDVSLVLTAFSGSQQIVERRARTTAVAGRTLLFPTRIDQECAGVSAPTCSSDETCVDGACRDPFSDPDGLADYFAAWAGTGGGDRCEPGGSPEVVVGEGQADYLSISSGEELQVEAGPQGGYHVWIAARIRNLKQSGSVTEVGGRIDDLDYDIPKLSVVFTFDPDEADYCKLFGLRLRLDSPEHPIDSLLGKPVAVTVTITDSDGDVGVGVQTITLSNDIL